MRKAINTQEQSLLEASLIIIGLQRYCFFLIPQAFSPIFFATFFLFRSVFIPTFVAKKHGKRMKRIAFLALLLVSFAAAEAQWLTVASYNIRYANAEDSLRGDVWSKRCQVICDQVNWERPAVWGAQEVLHRQLLDLQRGLDGYASVGVGRDDGRERGEYAAIFYRTDAMDLLASGHFWLNETPDRPALGWDAACVRICTWGHFRERVSGRELLFLNLHMDHVGVVARRESAQLVMQRMDSLRKVLHPSDAQSDAQPAEALPVVLTGDFNVDQTDEIYRIFTDSGALRDCYEAARLRFAENGTFHGYHPDRCTPSRIDHIFVSEGVDVDAYAVRTDAYWTRDDEGRTRLRTPSDHYPVFARIRW